MKEYRVVCIMQSALVSIRNKQINRMWYPRELHCVMVPTQWYVQKHQHANVKVLLRLRILHQSSQLRLFIFAALVARGRINTTKHDLITPDTSNEMVTPWILQVSTETWDDTDGAANLSFFIGFPTIWKGAHMYTYITEHTTLPLFLSKRIEEYIHLGFIFPVKISNKRY